MDEAANLVDSLFRVTFILQGRLAYIAAEHALSVTQVRMMGILRDREPGILQLAQHLGLEKSSLSGLIDRAAARGLVERLADPRDGRGVLVRMTARGHKLAKVIAAAVSQEVAERVAHLSAKEQQALATVLGGIVEQAAARQLKG